MCICILIQEVAYEMGRFRTFQTAMTLTLDWVMRHTVVYHSLTSTYVLNFIQIGKISGCTYGCVNGQIGHWTLRPALLCWVGVADLNTDSTTSLKHIFYKIKNFILWRFWLAWLLTICSLSLVTLARPSVSSSLQITNRSFTHASPYLWNQLPSLFRQPHSVHCPPGSPHPAHITSSQLPPLLSSPITASTFHSRLKTHLFHKSFPP